MNPCPFRAAAALSVVIALVAASSAVQAQPGAPTTVVVTGNPLGSDALAQPVTSLPGESLLMRRNTTLGDTLDGLPGAAASRFGPNSSRPVIRGLDGDRVKLLDNGAAQIDASNLSFDHAAAGDPLVVERIELLRGPAALIYGGHATGGVVQTFDGRIPRAPTHGTTGRAEVRLGGAADERAASMVLDGGQAGIAWHADAYRRGADDLRVPSHEPSAAGESLERSTRVRNSASRVWGGALGGSWLRAEGHAGLAVDGHRNDYGVTVEPDVTIRLRRDRLVFDSEQHKLQGWIEQVSLGASQTRYRHEEVEGSGEVGTRFSSRGSELRLQAHHRPLGPLRGVLGLQRSVLRFEALGEEAFVPGTRTRADALFVLEQWRAAAWQLQVGLRRERVQVDSDGDTDDAPQRFGDPRRRRFAPGSASIGATVSLGADWALGLGVDRTERAPTYYELYANGVHLATAAYERGDPELELERSRNLGAAIEWRRGAHQFKVSAFDTRFARYISLAATGSTIERDNGDAVPEHRFEPVRARLRGFEIEARWRAVQRPWQLDLSASADAVRGTDLDRREPLPRIAPARLNLAVDLAGDAWAAGIGMRHAWRQSRVAEGDRPTPGYTLWNLWARWQLPRAWGDWTVFAKLDNATNRLAYNATAAATIRDLTPQPGRSLSAGVRARF